MSQKTMNDLLGVSVPTIVTINAYLPVLCEDCGVTTKSAAVPLSIRLELEEGTQFPECFKCGKVLTGDLDKVTEKAGVKP